MRITRGACPTCETHMYVYIGAKRTGCAGINRSREKRNMSTSKDEKKRRDISKWRAYGLSNVVL